MPENNQQNRLISFLSIDCGSNYFNTREQIEIRNKRHFVDYSIPGKVSGSNTVAGLFSRAKIEKDKSVNNSDFYLTSSTTTDPSGASRKILDSRNDYYASSSIDSYKNGVEIIKESDWTAGLAKISAGTPGHLLDNTVFGIPKLSIISPDVFQEIDVFDPIGFVESGGNYLKFTYPIITSDTNQAENEVLDGIIEPFPIRPVIGNFSINFPFEPHSFKGEVSAGNSNARFANDSVLSVDYYLPKKTNRVPYLDAVDLISLGNDAGIVSASIGPSIGYFIIEDNRQEPFEDVVYPRGEIPSKNYDTSLRDVVNRMLPGGTTYITRKEKSATCGTVYDNAFQGTDSIAFGGMLY